MRKCRGVRQGNRGWFFCSEYLVWRVWPWDGRVKLNQNWAWWVVGVRKKNSAFGVRKQASVW